jgi:hypothetical protein
MNVLDEYQDNAFARRLARDYSKMPASMQWLFFANHFTSKSSVYIAFALLLGSLVSTLECLNSTWVVGGPELLSDSPLLVPAILCFVAAALVRWVIPAGLNIVFSIWYERKRASFSAQRG